MCSDSGGSVFELEMRLVSYRPSVLSFNVRLFSQATDRCPHLWVKVLVFWQSWRSMCDWAFTHASHCPRPPHERCCCSGDGVTHQGVFLHFILSIHNWNFFSDSGFDRDCPPSTESHIHSPNEGVKDLVLLKWFYDQQLSLIQGDQATLPLLAWQFVIIQVSEQDRVVDPVLAFARDQTIHFAQVCIQ
jgi:hypothetical protein